jgi:hypothetical protein
MRKIKAPLMDRPQIFLSRFLGIAQSNSEASLIPLAVILPRIIQECLGHEDDWHSALYGAFINA